MASKDDDQEEEGLPQLFDPPPGQDLDTDQSAPSMPKDRPLGVNQWGTTAAEERVHAPAAMTMMVAAASRASAFALGPPRMPPSVRPARLPDLTIVDLDANASSSQLR